MQSKQKKRIKPKIQVRTFTIVEEESRLTYGELNFVSFIRLRGKWLKNASFHIEQKIFDNSP